MVQSARDVDEGEKNAGRKLDMCRKRTVRQRTGAITLIYTHLHTERDSSDLHRSSADESARPLPHEGTSLSYYWPVRAHVSARDYIHTYILWWWRGEGGQAVQIVRNH